MFSGIIEEIGRITQVLQAAQAREILVRAPFDGVRAGDSIAVDGVCLTATEKTKGHDLVFFVSSETLDKTNLSHLHKDCLVNLERPVTAQTCLSGHIVQGHVDTVGHILSLKQVGDAFHMRITVPSRYRRYMVEKGSITVNGISLTINSLSPPTDGAIAVDLMIIPHTWEHTSLHDMCEGGLLNIEVDIIAKYVEAQLQPWKDSESRHAAK